MKTDTKATLVALTIVAVVWVIFFSFDAFGQGFPDTIPLEEEKTAENYQYYLVCELPNKRLIHYRSSSRETFIFYPWGVKVLDKYGETQTMHSIYSNCVKFFRKDEYKRHIGKNVVWD